MILLHFPHVLVGRRLKILDYGKNICATLEKYLSQSPCSCRAASASPPPRRARRGEGTTPWSAAGLRPHGEYGSAGATKIWNNIFSEEITDVATFSLLLTVSRATNSLPSSPGSGPSILPPGISMSSSLHHTWIIIRVRSSLSSSS